MTEINIEKAEKITGRKLTTTEKFLVENLYNEDIYSFGVDKNGSLILHKK